MANEITVTATLQYYNTGKNLPQEVLTLQATSFNITNSNYVKGTKSFPTTAGGTAIPLGGVTASLGWAWFKNTDSTNYITLLSAVSGTTLIRLLAGEACVFRFDPGVTAPAILANTAAVVVDYMILET